MAKDKNFSETAIASFLTKYRLFILVITLLMIIGTIGIVVGIELHRSRVNREAEALYELQAEVDAWKADFDPANPKIEEIRSVISEYQFQAGGAGENRRIFLLGEVAEQVGEYEIAAEYFHRVSESARGYVAATALLKAALLYEQAGDTQEAIGLFTVLVDDYDSQEEPRVLFTLGRLSETSGEYELATEFYNRLIDTYSSSGWTNLAYNRIIELASRNVSNN